VAAGGGCGVSAEPRWIFCATPHLCSLADGSFASAPRRDATRRGVCGKSLYAAAIPGQGRAGAFAVQLIGPRPHSVFDFVVRDNVEHLFRRGARPDEMRDCLKAVDLGRELPP